MHLNIPCVKALKEQNKQDICVIPHSLSIDEMKQAQKMSDTSRFLYFDEINKLVKCITGMLSMYDKTKNFALHNSGLERHNFG